MLVELVEDEPGAVGEARGGEDGAGAFGEERGEAGAAVVVLGGGDVAGYCGGVSWGSIWGEGGDIRSPGPMRCGWVSWMGWPNLSVLAWTDCGGTSASEAYVRRPSRWALHGGNLLGACNWGRRQCRRSERTQLSGRLMSAAGVEA